MLGYLCPGALKLTSVTSLAISFSVCSIFFSDQDTPLDLPSRSSYVLDRGYKARRLIHIFSADSYSASYSTDHLPLPPRRFALLTLVCICLTPQK